MIDNGAWKRLVKALVGFAAFSAVFGMRPAGGAEMSLRQLASTFYVATDGRDTWSGLLPSANARKSNGPFASVERALDAARQAYARGVHVRIEIRRGTYFLKQPIVILPTEPGLEIVGYKHERPVLSGGVRLTGWRRDEQGRWQVNIPQVERGEWSFSQLFVNGERRYRPRLPKEGYYFIADAAEPSDAARGKGFDRFRFQPGEIRADWANLGDVEVLPFHTWTMSRFRIQSVDEANHLVTFSGHTPGVDSWTAMPKGHRYLVENVKEALNKPGEWYLDRKSGVLTYFPMPGEDVTKAEVIAPRLERLIEMRGDPERGALVDGVKVQGLQLAHTNWNAPPEGNSFPQAEVNLGAAISARGARDCALQDCAIEHLGEYAVELGAGCKNCRIENCRMADLGAGGVKIGEMAYREEDALVADHDTVRNCLIAHGGRMHPAAVGVWIGNAPYNSIVNNDIHDLYYTGVSMGWSWGYGKSHAHHNTIAYNHIYQLGQGVLSDMGGIYTLGLTPGTTLHHNRIHDVESYDYGGWGIYFDEGTTGILAENNVVYRMKSAPFHQHYGRENRVVNNILAFGRQAELMRTRAEDRLSFTMERNIVYWTEGPLLGSNWTGDNYKLDQNLYWNAAGRPIDFAGMTLPQWQAKGQDVHSLIADPLFRDPLHGDYTLKAGSPATRIGFVPIDMSQVGPRAVPERAPAQREPPPAFPPSRP